MIESMERKSLCKNFQHDEAHWAIYSTLHLTKGVATLERNRVFEFDWEKNKFLLDTNMNMSNMLAAPQYFEIESLVVAGSRNRSRKMYNTLATFYDNYAIELQIGQKVYYKSPMTLFPLNADYQSIWDDGKETFRKPEDVVFDPKLIVIQQMYFDIMVHGNSIVPETNAKIVFALKGKLFSGVQIR